MCSRADEHALHFPVGLRFPDFQRWRIATLNEYILRFLFFFIALIFSGSALVWRPDANYNSDHIRWWWNSWKCGIINTIIDKDKIMFPVFKPGMIVWALHINGTIDFIPHQSSCFFFFFLSLNCYSTASGIAMQHVQSYPFSIENREGRWSIMSPHLAGSDKRMTVLSCQFNSARVITSLLFIYVYFSHFLLLQQPSALLSKREIRFKK